MHRSTTRSRTCPSFTHRLLMVLLAVALLPTASALLAHDETQEAIEAVLHDLEHQGDISEVQHQTIDHLYFELGNEEQTHHWLKAQKTAGQITEATFGYIENLLHLEHVERALNLVAAEYVGNGNVTRLGHLDQDPAGQIYNGVWGYDVGTREYALHTNSTGLHIIDVTNPAAPYRVQVIPMAGGNTWRDVDIHEDLPSGKTYAYVGAQSSGNLWVVDLSHLSGNTAHAVDSNPIPPAGYVDRGRTNWGHTVFINDGLLYMNSANSNGCQIFDLLQDPWDPPLISSWSGSQRDCHDSYARVNVPGSGGKNLLYSSDGYARSYRILDVTNVRTGGSAVLLGETSVVSGIYAHSNWLTEDSQYMFAFEEFSIHDVGVYDVSDPTNPTLVTTFQYSDDAAENARTHNGQIRGNYLILGYYEAGLRVFDVSNPPNPVEVGKWETWRDPDGDGNFNRSINGNFDGAWNVHVYLPSGTVLVSDTDSGLHLFQVDPVALPTAPANLTATGGNGQISLSWADASGETGYNVLRATTGGGPYTQIAERIVGTSFIDTGVTNGTTYYYVVNGTNAEGAGGSTSEASATPVVPPPCGDGLCELGEDCTTCAADCPSFSTGGATCGNGVCEAGDGEDCVTCAADCNGVQGGKPANRFCCGFGGSGAVGCGDSACTTGGFSCTETPQGGGGSTCCGDMTCDAPEDGFNCSLDCGAAPVCGDNFCDPGEDTCSCAADCGAPPLSEAGMCTDGTDNDCDAAIDCNDSDCSADPACQAVDCSTIGSKNPCNAEPSCRWDNKNKVCVAN